MSDEPDTIGRATYSPEDNKLRIYPDARLAADIYQRVKAAGYCWAPRQNLFVAPMWTPEREDIAGELCGEIQDEDQTLVDRAAERSERFEQYGENRQDDAERARQGVAAIADGIPLGQPILVGHHSERHARRDAKKIENGMRRAVRMWESAKYWEQRARGAVRAAKYKERADVRARRIKKLEADVRRQQRATLDAAESVTRWADPEMTRETALNAAGYCHVYRCFPLKDYPRELHPYEGEISISSALEREIITAAKARDILFPIYEAEVERASRWALHFENRLAYERAMLAEQGGTVADRIAGSIK